MGLDVIAYSKEKEKEKTGITEISEKLHHAIFNNGFASSCKTLKKIEDYYKTSLKLNSKEDISNFVKDLAYIRQFIGTDYIREIDSLINFLSNKRIDTVRIAGD